MKKVSVIMCTYNGELYLEEQLNSIIHQSYPIYEILIFDDRSTDQTMDILHRYAESYDNIHIEINKEQKGVNKNFYDAIFSATGDYIAVSDQDDVWLLDKIEKQIKYIETTNLPICMSKSLFFSNKVPSTDGIPYKTPNCNLIRYTYIGDCQGHSFLFSKELLKYVPPISVWCRLWDAIIGSAGIALSKHQGLKDDICYHEYLTLHRLHSQNVSMKEKKENFIYTIYKKCISPFFLYFKIKKKLKKQFELQYNLYCQLPPSWELDEAKRQLHYRINTGFFNYIHFTIYCVRYRNKILSTPDLNPIIKYIRALMFPITSISYYDHFIKK